MLIFIYLLLALTLGGILYRLLFGQAYLPAGRERKIIIVYGGGHTIPHPVITFPWVLGPTNHDINFYEILAAPLKKWLENL